MQAKGTFVLWPTKTKRPRDLPILPSSHEALTERKAAQRLVDTAFALALLDSRKGRERVRVSDHDRVDFRRWRAFAEGAMWPTRRATPADGRERRYSWATVYR